MAPIPRSDTKNTKWAWISYVISSQIKTQNESSISSNKFGKSTPQHRSNDNICQPCRQFIEDRLPPNEWTWNPRYCTLKHCPLYDSGDTGEAEALTSISGGLKRVIYFPRLITFKTLIPKITVLGKHIEPQMKNLIQRTILPLTPGGTSSLKHHTYFQKLPFAFSPSPLKANRKAAKS